MQERNHYNNNPLLKRVGSRASYTPDQVQEMMKCMDDPIYFITKYCKIVSLDSEEPIPFELFGYQVNFLTKVHNNRRVISMQPRQSGKALDVNTEIPTPNGFKKMGDLEIGDVVFGMDGKPTNVTFKSETHYKPTYKVTFSDNTTVNACEDHLWYGYDYHGHNKYRNELRTFTTKDVVDGGLFLYNSTKDRRFAVPVCDAVEFPEKDLPIEPYLLGLWLGDGSSVDGGLWMLADDFDSIKHLINREYTVYDKTQEGREKLLRIKIDGLYRDLRCNNLLNNKHIPEIYLQGSIQQRRDLLAGLLDTDGTVSNGSVSFSQCIKRKHLVDSVTELIYSLGYKTGEYIYKSDKPACSVRFHAHDVKSFYMPRKADAQELASTTKSRKKQIVAIERIDDIPTQCITVDNETHTYLCTRNYIVTHNTQTIAAYICWYIVFQRNQTVAILANKADAAREILSRCKFMYEYLPTWMQHGIKKWNEGSIALENGSKAFTAATSKSGLRGRSCITGDTKVCISNGTDIYHAEISSLVGCKGLKVLTEKGFKKFETAIYQGFENILKLTFDNGSSIRATRDHRFRSNDRWVRCDDVKLGDNLSGKIVKSIEDAGYDDVYDMYEVEETHSYYSNGVISHNCNLLYIDEAAAIPNNIADDFFTAIYPIVSAGTKTKIIITSTPIGYNHFWSYWNEAEKGKNGFIPVRVNYWEHPKRDDKWADEQKQLLGEVKYNQEVMCVSGDTLITLRDDETGEIFNIPISEAYELYKYEYNSTQ